MSLNGITIANFPSDIILDAGVIYAGSTKVGVTKGAPKFNPNRTFENIEFDGKYAPVKLLDRAMNGEPSIAFTMLELGGASTGNQLAKIEPGATVVTATGTTTYTPLASGALLVAGSYVADFRIVWERGNQGGNYFAVHFPVGFVHKYDIAGANKGEGMVNVEIVGRIDMSTGVASDPAYTLELRTALP
jgi:hypothetical protein